MRHMWVSWSTPSTGRYLFLSQAHYWGCHGIQVGFWNVGRNPHGGKWACALKKGIGLTRQTHVWQSGWRQHQAQGVRQEEQRNLLSPNALSFHHCTSNVLVHRQSLKLVWKDGYLFPYYNSTSFLPIRLHAIKLFPKTGCSNLLEWSWLAFLWR